MEPNAAIDQSAEKIVADEIGKFNCLYGRDDIGPEETSTVRITEPAALEHVLNTLGCTKPEKYGPPEEETDGETITQKYLTGNNHYILKEVKNVDPEDENNRTSDYVLIFRIGNTLADRLAAELSERNQASEI